MITGLDDKMGVEAVMMTSKSSGSYCFKIKTNLLEEKEGPNE